MKYLLFTIKRMIMKKNEMNFLKILTIILFGLSLQSGYSIDNSEINFNNAPEASLACNDTVRINMGFECIAQIYPDQLLEGNYPDMGVFVVNVIDQNGESIGDSVTIDNINYILIAEVIDTITGNSCWTHLDIRDISPPNLATKEISR